MNTDLNALRREADELLALDAKRTPGEWSATGDRYGHQIEGAEDWIAQCWDRFEERLPNAEDNAAFIAAAPRMAAFIRKIKDAGLLDALPQEQETPSRLDELDALFAKMESAEKVATWGGSFEREEGGRRAAGDAAKKLWDATVTLLAARAASPQPPKAPPAQEK